MLTLREKEYQFVEKFAFDELTTNLAPSRFCT